MRSALLSLSLQPALRPPAETQLSWTNPVLPGDHPDPSVIRVGEEFWAAATSGEWSPQFPLFRSIDLVHWQAAGSLFPEQPAWAQGDFWAPELVYDRGRVIAFYVARKRGGPLCVAFATASSPAGPYVDHGPIICDPVGSIDPCFARDEHGKPFLIWKEDGNSRGLPTPIWAQALAPDLCHLLGDRHQLITNDTPWEAGVVEGPYILRHANRFYMFYAGNDCCTENCRYAEGVARADHLLGPWQKFPGNPLIADNTSWRCPGHGTAVHGPNGKDYLLYHAYPAGGTIYIGREAVLDQILWSADGWPIVNGGQGPGKSGPAPVIDFHDDFSVNPLGPSWQWPVNTHPQIATGNGLLELAVPAEKQSAMVAVSAPSVCTYAATVTLESASLRENDAAWAGLTVIGDPFNTIGLGIRGRQLQLWRRAGADASILWQASLPTPEQDICLRVLAHANAQLQFSFRTPSKSIESARNESWIDAGTYVDASTLPAWNRGLRLGLLIEGPAPTRARWSSFHLETA